MNGVFAINDVVARKTFGAGPMLLVLLTMAPSASQLFALPLAPRIVRTDLRRFFFLSGLIGRLVLVAVAWVHDAWSFLALVLLNAVVQSAVMPVQNAVYQCNYAPAFRGRLFGWASTWAGLLTVVTAYTAGFAMNRDERSYRLIYPAAGLAGFLGLYVFGQIRLRRRRDRELALALTTPADVARPFRRGVFSVARKVLGGNRDFLRFESALMLYGLAFMSLQPCMAPYLVDVMHLDYQEASIAKGAIFFIAMVVATPLAGMLHDRIGLERLGALACGLLSIFAASLVLASGKRSVFGAFAVYGAAMACIHVVWMMGPIKYAGRHDASTYMAVHVALVGVRGLVGHPLGGAVSVLAGTPRATFAMAAVLFASASVWMRRLARGSRGRPEELRGSVNIGS